MKNVFIYTIIGLLCFGCKTEEKRTDFIINGNAKGVYNGIRAYLKVKEGGRDKVIDTAIVVDEKFYFTGTVPSPTSSLISINSVNGNLKFMLENSIIDVSINKANILESTVSGSKSQKDFDIYNKEMTKLTEEAANLKRQLRNNTPQFTLAKRDSVSKLFTQAQRKQQEYPLKYINSNTNSYYSLVLIDEQTNKKNRNIEDYIKAFENLNSELKSSPKGVALKVKLDQALIEYEKKSRVEIGKIAPNFEAPTPDGKMVSLNESKGKVTIIDFWAAWCGPCRRENPNVVKIYEKYHDQGLEIIGVSLDGTRTQKDPKQAWLNAIETDKLTWTQVSNLKYFQDPIAQLYNIRSIPAVFILDAEGKIAAKNLRGIALERKVQELLNR
ncbi:redoxin domain-containing protein [Winogradskyella sp. PC D3.3]